MTGKFLIENDYYLVMDERSWNIARRTKDGTKNKAAFTDVTYHRSPEAALEFYLEKKQKEAAGNAKDGTLRDLLDILSSERKRLENTLRRLYSDVCSLQLDKSGTEDDLSAALDKDPGVDALDDLNTEDPGNDPDDEI